MWDGGVVVRPIAGTGVKVGYRFIIRTRGWVVVSEVENGCVTVLFECRLMSQKYI